MKFVSTLLFACVVLGLARSEDHVPTEPGTTLELGKKVEVVAENSSLTVHFGKQDQNSFIRVFPCYGHNITFSANYMGALVQEGAITASSKSFTAGFEAGPANLDIHTTSPDTDYAPYSGMFDVVTANTQDALFKMCPTISSPQPTFKINMKKKSDSNTAVVSWDPIKTPMKIDYSVYRRDVKIGEDPVPAGVYETPCGIKLLFTKLDSAIKEDKKYSCSVTGLKLDTITSVVIVATDPQTGCSMAYHRVNLNDGASSLSCIMAIILFIAFYLFI